MAGNGRDSGRSVTARALSVLSAFDASHPELTLTEIARCAEIPLATAHRLAGELVEWGALRRDAEGKYSIGLRLWEIGLLAPVNTRLRQAALPLMRELRDASGDNVHLAVRDGFHAVYVDKLAASRSAPIVSRTGARLPLHATGVGKVLLAHADPTVLRDYCERAPRRHTSYTITEPGRLARELASVRERGFAQTTEEMTLGSCSVAVPIRGGDDVVIAALGVVAHSARAQPAKLVKPLFPAARAIRERLCQRDPGVGTGSRRPRTTDHGNRP